MAAVCHRFVQNAWKKELCSNCFKSKEEHGTGPSVGPVTVASVLPQGILRDSQQPGRRPKGTAVRFPAEESHVIGFGGEECFSSDDGEETSDPPGESPPGSEDEEERALQRLTRSNTDLNTSRPYSALLLGQPRRETLLVTVKPFGDADAAKEEPVSRIPVIKSRTVIRTSAFSGRADLLEKPSVVREQLKEAPPPSLRSVLREQLKESPPLSRSVVHEQLKEIPSSLSLSVAVPQLQEATPSLKEKNLETCSLPKEETPESCALDKVEDSSPEGERGSSTDQAPPLHGEGPESSEDAALPSVAPEPFKADDSHKLQLKFGGGSSKFGGVYKKAEEPVCTLSVRKIEDGAYRASKVIVEPDDLFPLQESRELAGEPDGRADSDEPPELPRSPPPAVDPRPSFLHGLVQRKTLPLADKPKVPAKPSKVLQSRKSAPLITPAAVTIPSDPTDAETCRTPKRQAPKPPNVTPDENSSLFARNPSAGHSKSNSPVTREKEKRERASSCGPKIPEPAPRTVLSLSAESLTAEVDKKRRARFSLRRLLGFGHPKDEERTRAETCSPVVAPQPRPRLEIIHPSDLTGATVEVLGNKGSVEDTVSTSSGSTDSKETEIMSCDSSNSSAGSPVRLPKPLPPPRSQSLDAWGKTLEAQNRPARPPPPKSAELLRQQKQAAAHSATPPLPVDNLYANLGEVRSGLAPNKPQRTASIRDASTDGPKRKAGGGTQSEDSGYESVELVEGKVGTLQSPQTTVGENVYESVTMGRCSSPECDAGIARHRRSEGNLDTSPEFLKFRGSFVRSTSLPYCGSETESDIYSPYSFYGSEEEDADWSSTAAHPLRNSRLKLRKGRSIVHRSLEDNYGAVIVANHEALSQVLEQVNMGVTIPVSLRGLKAMPNLRWTDFALHDEAKVVTIGRRTFRPAQWASHPVTLCLSVGQGLQSGLPTRGGSSTPTPITEFSDLVPARYLPVHAKDEGDLMQASVAVLTKLQVDTVQSYGRSLRESGDESSKEGTFILLQLINGLKLLQAQGIEEAPLSLSAFVLSREDRDPQPRLCVLSEPDGETEGSLCRCALVALPELLPSTLPLARLVGDLLARERSGSLSRAKSVLEFSLWGPSDVAPGVPLADRELALQRWLDLERATVLRGLVRTRVDLTPFEECHLLFLVRTNAKMMNEASLLLDSYKNP